MVSITAKKPEPKITEIVYKNSIKGYELKCDRSRTTEKETLKFTVFFNGTSGEEGCVSDYSKKICEIDLSFLVGSRRTSGDDVILVQSKYYEHVGFRCQERKRYNGIYGELARSFNDLYEKGELPKLFCEVTHQDVLKLCHEVFEKDFFSIKDGLNKLQLIPELVLLREAVGVLPVYASGSL